MSLFSQETGRPRTKPFGQRLRREAWSTPCVRAAAFPAAPILICTARLTKACRFDMLLNAQRLLLAQGHPVNVVLVGDGPERAALQDAAKDLGRAVRFYGECYDEPTLARLIMAADITV